MMAPISALHSLNIRYRIGEGLAFVRVLQRIDSNLRVVTAFVLIAAKARPSSQPNRKRLMKTRKGR